MAKNNGQWSITGDTELDVNELYEATLDGNNLDVEITAKNGKTKKYRYVLVDQQWRKQPHSIIANCGSIQRQPIEVVMEGTNIPAVLAALAWPVTTAILIFSFWTPLRALVLRLSEALSIKTIKLSVFGAAIELTPEQAKGALDELLKDIVESTTTLSDEDTNLDLPPVFGPVITKLPGFLVPLQRSK